ncbi:hypothetical protein P167DRAFT_542450 [Morchella conica CCBAS932]|uniref:Uncharacterized protein n=1 Tax=Morchella conica CCBAS932 TaxID=1392247 RepID=A0A3N4L369_9PEZI|nr:hypothetical protein P167DRAFT_542450 [Morchella conica CCBAS932]
MYRGLVLASIHVIGCCSLYSRLDPSRRTSEIGKNRREKYWSNSSRILYIAQFRPPAGCFPPFDYMYIMEPLVRYIIPVYAPGSLALLSGHAPDRDEPGPGLDRAGVDILVVRIRTPADVRTQAATKKLELTLSK